VPAPTEQPKPVSRTLDEIGSPALDRIERRPPPAADPITATSVAPLTAPLPVESTAALVTITGCLEADDDSFRLTDTSGAEAPKSRSWKTGFLRKRSASIAVVDDARRAGLPVHVGQRVALTGALVEREMHVRSVQRVGDTCKG
jgi:hypothetical protein